MNDSVGRTFRLFHISLTKLNYKEIYLRARSNDHTFDPETDEGQKGTECRHYVRIIGTRFLYHTTQFRVAIRSHHRKETFEKKNQIRNQIKLNSFQLNGSNQIDQGDLIEIPNSIQSFSQPPTQPV